MSSLENNWFDISVGTEADMPIWPTSISFQLNQVEKIGLNQHANVSEIITNVHVGTHVDAPLHFVPAGYTVESIPLSQCIGQALVIDLSGESDITPELLNNSSIPSETKRVLFKTDNSQLWAKRVTTFQENFVALTAEAADWIIEHGIQTVGIDYLSIQRWQDGPETHQSLLRANTLIIEGLNLMDVTAGMYELVCLPIKLVGSEGAPARAILRRLG